MSPPDSPAEVPEPGEWIELGPAPDGLAQIWLVERTALRRWLVDNHTQRNSVWLIAQRRKGTGPRIEYDDLVEEALCFGWVDSRTRTIDDARMAYLFSPRRRSSGWAGSNKDRVERLLAAGLMEPSGLAVVEAAKADGSWAALDDVEALVVPDDLAAEFAAQPAARMNFDAFPPGARKHILGWIVSARTAPTRQRRIAETVTLAAKNIRAS
jgi:uncharacterized protein YdeI (YjbR/CyaY-like superfamily)